MTGITSVKNEYKKVLSYVAAVLALVAIAIWFPRLGIKSNPSFHRNLSIISAITSLFAGSLALMRYYAKKVCPFLWVGVAFMGNALYELVYAYTYSFFYASEVPSSLARFLVYGWWFGRVYIAVMLASSFFTCRNLKPTVRYRKQEIGAFVFGALILALSIIVLVKLPLPEVSPYRFVSRPLEFLPGVLFMIPLVGFFRQRTWGNSPFAYWFILAIIICVVNQIIIVPFSAHVFDEHFMLGNLLRALGHMLVVAGLHSEIFKSYKDAEDRAARFATLQLMVSQVKDYALYLVDINGFILTWNKGASFIHGYNADEIIGKHVSIFYTRKDADKQRPREDLIHAERNGHFEKDSWRTRRDGSRFWASVLITPIYSAANELIAFSMITRDLTEKKELDEMLTKQNLLLQQSNEQLEQYAYIATHDLREPLRSISSFTQLLIRKLPANSPDLETYSAYIMKAVDRTRKLIDGLRTYSKLTSEGHEFAIVDMNASLDDAITLLRNRIDETHATIDSTKLPKVKGVASQLMYLFLHLLDNSLKYARPVVPPHVEIKCAEVDRNYEISVKDNGIGIPGEYSDKVFTIFQKLDKTDASHGTGIGLAICKKVMSQHGGNIWYTADDSGTTFYISFPMP